MAGKQRRLAEYERKRDLDRTPEPAGRARGGKRSSQAPRFVVQKHDATTVHYDVRLEAGGVLKSWAVPKGPSLDPDDKRLALPTEDHPLDYADFEGVIPEGQYGAGSVIVWDTGTYRCLGDDGGGAVEDAIEAGHLSVWLDGEKLTGGYALTRIGKGDRQRWLLVKKGDDQADPRRDLLRGRPESVVSGRTVEQVAEQAEEAGAG